MNIDNIVNDFIFEMERRGFKNLDDVTDIMKNGGHVIVCSGYNWRIHAIFHNEVNQDYTIVGICKDDFDIGLKDRLLICNIANREAEHCRIFLNENGDFVVHANVTRKCNDIVELYSDIFCEAAETLLRIISTVQDN